jgi:hypothetical protein
MKISIHVGMGKTGSTSIQTFLEKNHEALLQKKIFYSKNLDNIGIKNLAINRLDNFENLPEIINHLNHFLKENKIQHFIWSLESLFTTNKEIIQTLKKLLIFTEIEIIVFVRRQDHWYQSAFYQWGWKHKTYHGSYLIDFEKFYSSRIHLGNYIQWIDNWAESFGVENIIVQPMENQQMPKGLILTFCELIKLETSNLITDEIIAYQNLGHYYNLIIGICNSACEGPILNEGLINMLATSSKKSTLNEKYKNHRLISPLKQVEIIEHYKEVNKEIALKYLKRQSGILFFEPIPNIDENWKPFEDLNLNNTLPILFEIILSQNNELSTIRNRIQALEKNYRQSYAQIVWLRFKSLFSMNK